MEYGHGNVTIRGDAGADGADARPDPTNNPPNINASIKGNMTLNLDCRYIGAVRVA